MITKEYKFKGITVTLYDPCETEEQKAERQKRLEEAVRKFFIAVEREKAEKNGRN